MKQKGIVRLAKVVMKILEIVHWVGAALMLAATVCSLAAPEWVKYFVGLDAKEYGAELNVYGFEIIAPVENGSVDMKTLFLFGIGAVIILGLMAMVFRNLYLPGHRLPRVSFLAAVAFPCAVTGVVGAAAVLPVMIMIADQMG